MNEMPFLNENYRIQIRLFSEWNEQDWYPVLEDVVENAAEFVVRPGRYPTPPTYMPVRWHDEAVSAHR
jgi:hypothetical protein